MSGKSPHPLYRYLPDGSAFVSSEASRLNGLYFPLCGIDATGIKSSITPSLGGDIKIDKNRYLTKPVSRGDLRRGLREFYCTIKGKGVFTLAAGPKTEVTVEAGMFWHKVSRRHRSAGILLDAVNFVPVTGERVELMEVTVKNLSRRELVMTPTFYLPIFGRVLANKHDHEHVTSLLHRIEQHPRGVCVKPTMIFDERGHKVNETFYYVLGADGQGKAPAGTFPTEELFYGNESTDGLPETVEQNKRPVKYSPEMLAGKEAAGALRFKATKLAPGVTCRFRVVLGIAADREEMEAAAKRFLTPEEFGRSLAENKAFWSSKADAIRFSCGDPSYNAWMRWVTIQPVLRRIFGCSFLPDHDYGKGGKGWRDIWQDLLSLILIEPENVRGVLVNNFAGIRIDGSNATIIGAHPGEFIADRNAISRVWMDHGVWPFVTLMLYIHQTGDYDILLEENTYFRDAQLSRAFEKDHSWTSKNGNFLTDKNVKTYKGTVCEHLLVQHLVQFFNVGEHNIIRLEDADWNDGLDMARERGESVAFTSFYGGNLLSLADILEQLAEKKGIGEIEIASEIRMLLDTLTESPVDYDNAPAKEAYLFEIYFPAVQPEVSGDKITVPITAVVADLRKKGEWIFNHIRSQEKVSVSQGRQKSTWFNGYYDNKGERVEGIHQGNLRMTLAGQVFPLMSGLAGHQEAESVIAAVRRFLKDETLGGIRLNTDFKLPHYMELGRAFGFAYGTKENGAFFSHMNVMYAYALYKQGFVREGYEVLQSIYRMSIDTDKSKIYPGIPEYFDSQGRGYYHYLTGSASWLVLTLLTQVFGVRGQGGDLRIEPKLVKEEFIRGKQVSTVCHFAGKTVTVTIENPQKLDYGKYHLTEVTLDGDVVALKGGAPQAVTIGRAMMEQAGNERQIRVVLGR